VFKEIPVPMRVASLFSGGKDSAYALYIAQQWGWEVTQLVSLFAKNPDSFMYHTVNIHLTKHLAQAIDIPLHFAETAGEKEKELNELKHILKPLDIDGVVSGAIASEYQRTRIEQVCDELGIKSFTPLWHKHQELLLHDQVNAGFHIIIVGVFAQGFDETWLGRTIDEQCIMELRYLHEKAGINSAGEGGEFETLVVDGPPFKQKLVIDEMRKYWHRDRGTLVVKKAHLE